MDTTEESLGSKNEGQNGFAGKNRERPGPRWLDARSNGPSMLGRHWIQGGGGGY